MSLSLRKFNTAILFGILYLNASLAFSSEQLVPTFKAHYKLSHNSIEIGHVELTVEALKNNQYQLISSTQTSGVLAFVRDDDVVESSLFEVSGESIRPIFYQYKQNLGDELKDVRLSFDWPNNSLTNSSKGHDWKLAITEGVLDKALMQIALMLDLKEPKPSLTYPIADGGKLKQYVFTTLGTETVTIAKKRYETIKLARKKDDKPLITYYWCAKELHNIPVLIQREKVYGTFEMRLLSVKFDD